MPGVMCGAEKGWPRGGGRGEGTERQTSSHVELTGSRVLCLLNQQKLTRGQTGNSGTALWGPLLQQGEREPTAGAPACRSLRGGELVPYTG